MKKHINWGIIGLGKIANKFASDLKEVSDAKLYAVASRNIEKARAFSKTYDANKAYGSYAELMQDENVDVIYIATPHTLHHALTIECIQNEKAVLCEKPFAMNSQEAQEMIELARSRNVFLMEALWTMFLPHFQFVLKKIKSEELGRIKSLKANFGFSAEFDKSKRLFNKSLGGGSLLDIGIYPAFMAYCILGKPDKVEAHAEFAETGVDMASNFSFHYPGNVKAELFSTFKEKTSTTAEIELEKGTIILNSRFHEPTSVTVITEGNKETIEFGVTSIGYNYEAAHVTEMLQQGKTESDLWTLDRTLDLMNLLDEIRQKIGLQYK